MKLNEINGLSILFEISNNQFIINDFRKNFFFRKLPHIHGFNLNYNKIFITNKIRFYSSFQLKFQESIISQESQESQKSIVSQEYINKYDIKDKNLIHNFDHFENETINTYSNDFVIQLEALMKDCNVQSMSLNQKWRVLVQAAGKQIENSLENQLPKNDPLGNESTQLKLFNIQKNDRMKISKLLYLNSSQISKLIWRLNDYFKRKLNSKHFKSLNTTNKTNTIKTIKTIKSNKNLILEDWFSNNNKNSEHIKENKELIRFNSLKMNLSSSELNFLIRQFNLNYDDIKSFQTRKRIERKRKQSKELYQNIIHILKQFNFNEDILEIEQFPYIVKELEEKTKLNIHEIQTLISEKKLEEGWSETKKKNALLFLQSKNFESLSSEDIDELQIITNLNRKQIFSFISRLKQNKIVNSKHQDSN